MGQFRLRLRRGGFVRVGAWFVLLAAVMPNTLYVGHWPGARGAEEQPAVTAAGEESEPAAATHSWHAFHSRFHANHPPMHQPLAVVPEESPVSQDDDHALHCHTGPSNCGPQATTGSLWVGEDGGLLTLDSDLRRTYPGVVYPDAEPMAQVILQPPREL